MFQEPFAPTNCASGPFSRRNPANPPSPKGRKPGNSDENQQPATARHVVVYGEDGVFCAWPANNGLWSWDGGEILVGFTRGKYEMVNGHNIAETGQEPWLARSTDGGETWHAADPEDFAGDGGKNWNHVTRIGETGTGNGNPPALVRLNDGRLCCAYGDRARRKMLVRLSADGGRSWGAERVLRDGYASHENDSDFGYPRMVQRADGSVVTIYYWACKDRPNQHIAASIWKP